MKNRILSAIAIYLLMFATVSANEKSPENIFQQKAKALNALQNRIVQGKEFIIGVPQNEYLYANLYKLALEIYVTSNVNTTVTLQYRNKKITKDVKAMEITTFSSRTGDIDFECEIYESEIIVDKSITIKSPDSVSVYVLNSKETSSDGFLALPVSTWGTNYIHNSYYDFYEKRMPRANGFLIIAAEDSTVCNILLRGVGNARTERNRTIGNELIIILNKGDIYPLKGQGTNLYSDFSGSQISSNKKIGLISFHERAIIPNIGVDGGRDYLVEMLTPVSSWGKKYTTAEFSRKGKGDYFRIIAAYDNTQWTVNSYDKETGKFIFSHSGTLDAGEFFDKFTQDGKAYSIRGSSVWEADKPILVMQYAYSADWDGSINFDPFMIMLTPEEQYVAETVFQTPSLNSGFSNHWFNIIAIGDSTDKNHTKLKSISIDGTPVWRNSKTDNDFLESRIPGTNLHWAQIAVSAGAHTVSSNTKFGGYIYGYGMYNSYGWPAGMEIDPINETDTVPPEISVDNIECGHYSIAVTEFTNGNVNDFPRQIDKGIWDIYLANDSYNCEISYITDPIISQYPVAYEFFVELEVVNKSKPANIHLIAVDHAGNQSEHFISYPDETLETLTVELKSQSADSSVIPGQKIPVDITFQSDKWDIVYFSEIKFRIIFPKHAYLIDSLFFPYIDPADCSVNEFIEADNKIIEISYKSNSKIDKNTLFAVPILEVMNTKNKITTVTAELVSSNIQTECTNIEVIPADIKMDFCAQDLSEIMMLNKSFEFISVSPQPADGNHLTLDIFSRDAQNINYEIINSYGSVVIKNHAILTQKSLNQINIDISSLSSGVFYLKISNDMNSDVKKIILTK